MTSSYRLYWHNIKKASLASAWIRPDISSTVINIFVITACHSLYSMLSTAIITLTSRGKILRKAIFHWWVILIDYQSGNNSHKCTMGTKVRQDLSRDLPIHLAFGYLTQLSFNLIQWNVRDGCYLISKQAPSNSSVLIHPFNSLETLSITITTRSSTSSTLLKFLSQN